MRPKLHGAGEYRLAPVTTPRPGAPRAHRPYPHFGRALLVCAGVALVWSATAAAVPAVIERPRQITEQDRQAAARQAAERGFKAPMADVGGRLVSGEKGPAKAQIKGGNGRRGVNHGQ